MFTMFAAAFLLCSLAWSSVVVMAACLPQLTAERADVVSGLVLSAAFAGSR